MAESEYIPGFYVITKYVAGQEYCTVQHIDSGMQVTEPINPVISVEDYRQKVNELKTGLLMALAHKQAKQ